MEQVFIEFGGKMSIYDYGYDEYFEKQYINFSDKTSYPARIISQYRDIYEVIHDKGKSIAKLSGKLANSSIYPIIGDWVVCKDISNSNFILITSCLERKNSLKRTVNKNGQNSNKPYQNYQALAANIDLVFIVSSLNLNFNLGRIERYLTLAFESKANPIILLNKADLCTDSNEKLKQVQNIALDTPVYILSAIHHVGIENIRHYLSKGKTGVLVGSSGVGKSTIINELAGEKISNVYEIRDSDDKGRHTTTDRRLIRLNNGGMLIDSPGIREVHVGDDSEALSMTFNDISDLSKKCKFKDCTHTYEPGCAVIDALEKGLISEKRFSNFKSLQKEQRYIELKERIFKRKAEKSNFKKYREKFEREEERKYNNELKDFI